MSWHLKREKITGFSGNVDGTRVGLSLDRVFRICDKMYILDCELYSNVIIEIDEHFKAKDLEMVCQGFDEPLDFPFSFMVHNERVFTMIEILEEDLEIKAFISGKPENNKFIWRRVPTFGDSPRNTPYLTGGFSRGEISKYVVYTSISTIENFAARVFPTGNHFKLNAKYELDLNSMLWTQSKLSHEMERAVLSYVSEIYFTEKEALIISASSPSFFPRYFQTVLEKDEIVKFTKKKILEPRDEIMFVACNNFFLLRGFDNREDKSFTDIIMYRFDTLTNEWKVIGQWIKAPYFSFGHLKNTSIVKQNKVYVFGETLPESGAVSRAKAENVILSLTFDPIPSLQDLACSIIIENGLHRLYFTDANYPGRLREMINRHESETRMVESKANKEMNDRRAERRNRKKRSKGQEDDLPDLEHEMEEENEEDLDHEMEEENEEYSDEEDLSSDDDELVNADA